jgi:hypothetical protein
MKTLGMLTVVIALTAGLHYGGIVNLTPIADQTVQILEQYEVVERGPIYTIIGLDVTAGRERELMKDRKAIGELIRIMRAGDHMVVYLIHSRAESEQEAVFSTKMPDNQGPMSQVLTRAKHSAESSWSSCWDKNVISVIHSDKKQQTDLFGFMRFVASQKPEFLEHKKAILLLFTDGQQVGDGFNFEKSGPTNADLERAEKMGLIPELPGVSLVFAGVTPTHRISNEHWRKIQSFWKDYGYQSRARSTKVSSERIML